ncbi:TRC40/GET3/ArsA family transport-energizing ATPase [Sediminibacillus dalangtanensis]|uniref:TRC40/GET3/ArsA family transport-energizing ATPase n=1 Tax=Sediminibacillus dalangtanensis TaxID=2729421 RepID=A0ABX7VS68_9BACI|nr:ArsA family ATPase [Sediminibacillus dalangtanensis]QTM98829.1 TRC40/GET3/ArsA family transport-energizing ATPase [Sediminibacillus dalangtanensis]
MNDLLQKPILFVGGKGGVGKSTTAASLAYSAAEAGKRVLLVSTDPAHNLGDIFSCEVGAESFHVADCLSVLEVDAAKEAEAYIKGVKDNLSGLVKSSLVEEVNRQMDMAKASPGAEEAALFDRIVSIILEEREHFDYLIFDTAPTGHTVRLLSLPELMGVWMDGMLERRRKTNENYSQLLNDGDPVEDPIFDVLVKRRQKFEHARTVLLDHKETGFLFVLNPEKLPIEETKKAIAQLEPFHIHIDSLVVNKVLPEYADGDFFQRRKQIEQPYLDEIASVFSNKKLFYVPLFSEDMADIDSLSTYATYLTNSESVR